MERAREAMVRDQIVARGIRDARVLSTLRVLPRHLFVPRETRGRAYDDGALPIGHNATISQPIITATMTEALRLTGVERVLEIGTGSGYQTAILCELAGEVYSIEIDKDLAAAADSLLKNLGYGDRLQSRVANGEKGWPDAAPFDRILLTAAPERVPKALLDQLADGGILVAPIGPEDKQKLVVIEREGSEYRRTTLGAVRFLRMRTGKD
jgi:protein-L-isoaspartate(D-aspartate) O-methyltransferase